LVPFRTEHPEPRVSGARGERQTPLLPAIFIEREPLRGCGVTIDVVRAMLEPDSEVSVLFEEAIRGAPEAEKGEAQNSTGSNQWINRDNIRNNPPVDPDVIPMRSRDYSSEAFTDNSVSYAVRRLGKERPDLLEKVKQGDMSARATMVLGPDRRLGVGPSGRG
jgi:hypothetical protein